MEIAIVGIVIIAIIVFLLLRKNPNPPKQDDPTIGYDIFKYDSKPFDYDGDK